MPPTPRVAIIGAGIIGASVAYHLARRGAAVTLLDGAGPAGGVTRHAFGWITVAHGQPEPYARLRLLAVQEYRLLERELPGLAVHWCGALSWSAKPATTERFVREHIAWGHDVRLLERAEVARLEPALLDPPAVAAHAPGEGAVDPAAATLALVEGARQAGAVVRLDAAAHQGLEAAGGRITGVRTAAGALAADVVVVAAGIATPALCAPFTNALPVEDSPAILVRFAAAGVPLNGIVAGPHLEARPEGPGILRAAEDWIDDTPANGPAAVAGRTLAAARAHLKGAGAASLLDVAVGHRPIPADGLPIVGRAAPGLYVAVMHAGVTLAPLVGRLAAAEILDDVEVAMLATCRPGRFG